MLSTKFSKNVLYTNHQLPRLKYINLGVPKLLLKVFSPSVRSTSEVPAKALPVEQLAIKNLPNVCSAVAVPKLHAFHEIFKNVLYANQ